MQLVTTSFSLDWIFTEPHSEGSEVESRGKHSKTSFFEEKKMQR